jgi:formylglycine-generating enzyme required for sulfatase activity
VFAIKSGSTLDQIRDWFLDNLPQVIGVALAALVAAALAWLGRSARDKAKLKVAARKPVIAPKPSIPSPSIPTIDSSDSKADRGGVYLADLIRRGSTLSFGDPASWSVGKPESEGLVTLEQVWTPLRVADSHSRVGRSGTHENMAEEDEGIGLQELFSSTDDDVIILGDPGSGKSTSMASLAVQSARRRSSDHNAPLPVWVALGTVTNRGQDDYLALLLSGVPEVQLAAARGGPSAGVALSERLRRAVEEGRALLLLDGLDEVKEHLISKVRSAVGGVLALKNGVRVVVTCRTFDYRQSTPSRRLPIERELELLPYNKSEQALYVERWYAATVGNGRFTPHQASALQGAMKVELLDSELAELAESPLLLALLTLVHSEEAKLPDTRAVVCDRAITYMLADSAKWRMREAGSSTVAAPPVLSLAIELAYRAHVAEESASTSDVVGITIAEIESAAASICRVLRDADTGRPAPSPQDLVQRFVRSHGLLVERSNEVFGFAHRSFQEFLAGQHFSAGAHREEAIQRGGSAHWREPFRLMASLSGHEGENIYFILALIEELVFGRRQSTASVLLGAEMLAEIGRRRIALRQFGYILSEGVEGATDGLWPRTRDRVSAFVEDNEFTLAERERSATVVAILGDKRFPSDGRLSRAPSMIEIPGGTSTIGSIRLSELTLAQSGGFVDAPRRFDFPRFSVGRYLVTNAEFRCFVEDDGYLQSSYWGDLGGGWVTGDPGTLERIRADWLATVYEHHGKEIRDGEIDKETLEDEAVRRTAPRKAPYYWLDRRFNAANQPVVGINYWEAMAYCSWATAQCHRRKLLQPDWSYRLPTEFEWERASRPEDDDRLYPWGDEWQEDHAHVSTNLLNMRRPSPVGIYLQSWPGGPCDIAGNVWEWTDSLFLPYAAENDGGRLSDNFDERVVRGSSWYNSSSVATCSSRAIDRSYNLFYDVGFRMVAIEESAERPGCVINQ